MLRGTPRADVICGLGGNDVIYGGDGQDVLLGGRGNDRLLGQAGGDRLYGGDGNDVLKGGVGPDLISGDAGTDTVSYSDHPTAVTVDLDGVRDDGSRGERDLVTTTVENIIGGSGPDRLRGSAGPNTLSGGGGADRMRGLAGNDNLIGGDGTDSILAGPGSDTLRGGAGPDTLDGGSGVDTVTYADHARPVVADLDGVRDDGSAGERDRIRSSVENLTGGSASDSLTGSEAANTLTGGSGADVLRGGGGSDRLVGNAGPDIAQGGAGDDQLFGQSHNDRLVGGVGDDRLSGGPGVDVLDGGAGSNVCDFTTGETTTSTCRYDVTGPAFSQLTASPSSLVPGTVYTISVRATDRSGVSSVSAYTQLNANSAQFDWCGQDMTRISGTAQDGIWALTCTAPGNAINGTYTVTPFALDGNGNWTNMNSGTPDPARASFSVTGGSSDATGPAFSQMTASPRSLVPGSTYTISVRATDTTGVTSVSVYTVRNANSAQFDWCGQDMTQVSGTAQDGIWALTCTVPSNALTGAYTVTPFALDGNGNWTNMNAGTPDPARATFTVSAGSSDATGPAFSQMTASPNALVPGTVYTISVRASDPSGVSSVSVYTQLDANSAQFDWCGQDMTQVSGTAQDGVWALTCTTPANALIGSYTVTPFAIDGNGNWTNINSGTSDPARATFTVS